MPFQSLDERFRALVEVSRAITASLSLDQVLNLICAHAARLLAADSALITAVRSEEVGDLVGAHLKVVATTPNARIRIGQTLALDGSLSGKAVSERRTVVVNDVLNDPAADHEVASAAGVQQAIVTPLHYGEDPLGTIAVFNFTPHRPYEVEDGELLAAFAAQAAIAIHNAELFEKEEKQLAELRRLRAIQEENLQQHQGLIRVGMALSSHLSLEEVLQTLVESAHDALNARYAALGVLDKTGTALSSFYYSGVDEKTATRIGRLPRGGGTLGLMLREARTVRIAALQRHPYFAGFPDGHPPMDSLLGVPITIRGRVFGNLYVTEKIGASEFSVEDEALAELLAAQAAVAIDNARLYEARNQFFAIVNHEIKNAAAGVLGWTERLRSTTGDAERRIREGANYAFVGAQHLNRLVVDLLDLSRIEFGRLELEMKRVDLRALIREVVAAVSPSAEERKIDVKMSGLDQRAIVDTDRARVRQILLNLLANAIKFSKEGGSVDLELEPRELGFSLTVRDSGPGIDPGLRERIFDVYAGTADSETAGTGLGLAISSQLAGMLGGELTLLDDGPGAHFRLELPERRQR